MTPFQTKQRNRPSCGDQEGRSGSDEVLLGTLVFPSSETGISGNFWDRIKILGRKAMTNLDSILKSRDITLPTKVPLVKAMVFPVVMYACESWTIKKAER